MRVKRTGFTVVEVTVSIVIATLIVLGMIPLLIHLFGLFNTNMRTARQVNETQLAAAAISSDMQIMNRLLGRPLSGDSRTPAPSGGWTFRGASANSRTLILRLPATTAAHQSDDRELVYNANTGTCGDDALPLYYTAVYYLHNQTLYRRTILDATATPCPGQNISQRNSCLSGCSVKDLEVATGVTRFVVDYYTQSHNSSPNNGIYNSSTPIDAPQDQASARVTLATRRTINGAANDYEISIRETKIW